MQRKVSQFPLFWLLDMEIKLAILKMSCYAFVHPLHPHICNYYDHGDDNDHPQNVVRFSLRHCLLASFFILLHARSVLSLSFSNQKLSKFVLLALQL